MPLTAAECQAILAADTKRIVGSIAWEGRPDALTRQFRVGGLRIGPRPLSIKGWYNAGSGKLSYSIRASTPSLAESPAWIGGGSS